VKNVDENKSCTTTSLFSSLFGGKKDNANTNKNCLSGSDTNHSNNVKGSTKKKKCKRRFEIVR
jgi:hypothetical protein